MEVTVGGMAQGQNQGAKELLPKERFPLLLIRLVGVGRGGGDVYIASKFRATEF